MKSFTINIGFKETDNFNSQKLKKAIAKFQIAKDLDNPGNLSKFIRNEFLMPLFEQIESGVPINEIPTYKDCLSKVDIS